MVLGEDELGVGELDAVRVEEHAELGVASGGRRRVRVPVDDAVVVAVHAARTELLVDEVAGRVLLFLVALQVGQPFTTRVEAVGDVPVVVDRGSHVAVGDRRPGVHDETGADERDAEHHCRKDRASLEADLAALVLLGELGDLLRGRCFTHEGGRLLPPPVDRPVTPDARDRR
ncbi:MAG: hypothetical protein WAS51_05375 [Ilumatobacteraceae bacterium]